MVPYRWYSIPLLAIACFALSLTGDLVAVWLPSGAVPIDLTAGLAVAALLASGPRPWPGIFLGAYAAALWQEPTRALQPLAAFEALVLAAQALFGAMLTRHLFRASLPLVREAQVVRFLLLAGPVACLLSALATFAPLLRLDAVPAWHAIAGRVPGEGWLAAWSSNTLGVLIGAPLALLLWPGSRQLRRAWGSRVAIPLVITGALLVLGQVALDRFEQREAELADQRQLEAVFEQGFVHLDRAIESLHFVEHFFQASQQVTAEEFALFTARVLRWPGLHSIEWVPRVGHVGALRGGDDGDSPPVKDPAAGEEGEIEGRFSRHFYPSLYIQPESLGRGVRGFDYGSSPARRGAIERARDSGEAAAAPPLGLLQTDRKGIPVFIPVYRQGFDPVGATVDGRRQALRGFIKGNFDIENLFEPLVVAAARAGVHYRLSDLTPGAAPQRLIDNVAANEAPSLLRELSFANRLLQVELHLPPSWQPGVSASARLYQGFSVLAALLVALATLAAAGRNSAAEAMVFARTAALRASEGNLDVTLNSIGDGVLVTDTQGRIVRLNPVAERLMGWTQADAQGEAVETVFRIINEYSREPAVVPVAEVLCTGAIKGLANHTVLIARDGTERAIADSAAPIHGADGRVQGVVLVFRDVSEERVAERALEASEKRYREFIEQAPYGVFVQTGGTFAYLNPKARELLGATDESQLLGRPVLEFLHPDSREAVAARIRQLNQLGIPAPPLEEQWRRLDGGLFHAEATAVPHVHEGVRGALVMLHDISDRKAAEAQRDRFFDLSPDPQCIIDATGRFLRVNPAFSEVLGWSREEFLASGYLAFVHPEDMPQVREGREALGAGATSHQVESRFRCRDGGWRWLSWSLARAPEDGMLYGVARDVTERRDTIEALTRARAEAEYANRAKSAFLATMSHEIRTPMNGVVGLADVLSHGELGEHEADLVQSIRVSAQTLLRLIDDILDFSKIEAGRLELENAPVCLEELVEELCQSLAPVAAARGVRLAVFVAPEVPHHVLGDEVRLRQLLYNLVGNAIKFSGGRAEPGQVAVRAEVCGQAPLRLSFSVVDNGIGMSGETVATLFQPFTQAEVSTTRRFGGTGLGLAICQRLVDMMGGTIAIDSREGEGTRVRVELPFALADTEGDGDTPDLGGVHCAIVATPGIQSADWQAYLRHAGARVACVADLDAAMASAAGPGDIQVVILDQREPIHAALPLNQLFEGGGDVRYVLVSGGRRRRTRLQGGRVVIVEGELPRRLVLLRAVALAAGRLPADAVLDGGERAPAPRRAAPVAQRPDAPILVVEDDAMNRKVILEQLNLLGYGAEVAVDGADALQRWRDRRHALILSDLHMPVMDGYALARAIRAEESPEGRTPIIVLSANALRGEANRAYGAGIDDYLTKPVSLERLDGVLDYWLARRRVDNEGDNPREEAHAPMDNDGIDIGILRDFIGDDPVKVRNFLADYRDAALRLRVDIHRAEQSGDLLQLASLAHRLKSSSRWVGALTLGELCAGLEKAGRAGDRAAIGDYLSRFDQNHARIMADIERHLRDAAP